MKLEIGRSYRYNREDRLFLSLYSVKKYIPYNPDWIIAVVESVAPERIDVIEMLRNCTMAYHRSAAYVQFIDVKNANQESAVWQFKECLRIDHPSHDTILIDILNDGKIGGIEFWKYL